MSRISALALLLVSARALAADALAVLAVADAPAGPGSELAELTHELRAACRDRVGGVLEVTEIRARLIGAPPQATLADLERACAGAESAFERAEYSGAARALRDVAAAAEAQPPSAAAHALFIRALARLAYAEKLQKDAQAAGAALDRLVAASPAFAADPAQYPPSYLKDLEAARGRATAAPVELTVTSNGEPAEVFVDGRPAGSTPVKLKLAPGRHRVAAATAAFRLPPAVVVLEREPRAVVLDAATAGALRLDAGPGLAAAAPQRGARALAAGAWMGATRVVAASIVVERGAPLFAGTLYDVARGAAVREGRVRMEAGTVSAASLGALAAFLLTGQPSREVTPAAPKLDLPASAPAPAAGLVAPGPSPRPRAWMRPAAYGTGGAALGLVGLAVYEAIASRNDTRAADALPRPDGAFVSSEDHALYDSRRASAGRHQTLAYASAASAGAFAIAAGVLGYLSRDDHGAAVVRF